MIVVILIIKLTSFRSSDCKERRESYSFRETCLKTWLRFDFHAYVIVLYLTVQCFLLHLLIMFFVLTKSSTLKRFYVIKNYCITLRQQCNDINIQCNDVKHYWTVYEVSWLVNKEKSGFNFNPW